MDDKVIFLDIDGPMIPATMVIVDRMASWHRLFPPTTIHTLNAICDRTGAKVVFNTTHNTPAPDIDGRKVDDIEVAMVKHGFKAEHLYPKDFKTRYPALRRDEAVRAWLAAHPDVTKWIALDDSRFTDEPNLIWIDPDAGLHIGHANQAIEMLGGRAILIFM